MTARQYSLPLSVTVAGQSFTATPCSISFAVSYSSGISSWAAAKRLADQHGTEGMVLVFADTKIEDEDNYRYLEESAANIGAPLLRISDGRDPWQVMRDERMIGNSQFDPCSKILKRQLLDRWRDAYCCQATTKIVLGISWDEEHRITQVQKRNQPWQYLAPLCDKPWLSKADCLEWSRREGIEPPRMYAMGFAHANCGGFCIKAGQKSFKLLLENFPARYRDHEAKEAAMRELGGDHTLLRDRSGGTDKNLTLRELRERIEAKQTIDETDIGGCGCALPL